MAAAYTKKPYGNQGTGQSWKRQAGSNGRQRGLATGVNSRFGGGGLADATAHSASLKTTPFVAPGDAARKNREALLLRTLVNHAWLIEDVAEEFADLSFDNRAFADLRDALLAAVADEKTLDTSGLRNHLNGSGFSPHLEQIERLATNKCHAFAEPDADRITVENGWRDILSLHQQQYLRDQLAEAERDYTTNMEESALEEALARILELQRQIATIVPKEAALE